MFARDPNGGRGLSLRAPQDTTPQEIFNRRVFSLVQQPSTTIFNYLLARDHPKYLCAHMIQTQIEQILQQNILIKEIKVRHKQLPQMQLKPTIHLLSL